MATITIKGVNKLQRKLGKVASINVLRDPMERSVKRIQRDMADYPPQRAGSRYIRGYGMEGGPRTSERLGQKWTTRVRRSGNGLIGKVGNKVSYAPWVQSERFQAWMHRGRWQTDQQVVNRNRKAIVDDFQRAIDRALSE
jgi:hypothetical protein